MKPFIRKNILRQLEKEYFDVLVVGGGITGAGIALDAASRGLKTALVEKSDFGSGTSSKSTKLIHGGLRYLKDFNLNLVKEFGRERKILFKNAPHLVFPKSMLLPFFYHSGLGKWKTIFALSLYDFLISVEKKEAFKILSASVTKKKEALLEGVGLRGSCLYTEYQTDDRKLVIDVIKTAHNFNASCLNHLFVKNVLINNKIVSGVKVTDLVSKKNFSIKARLVVNATGPWSDVFLQKTLSEKKQKLSLSKGVHLVFLKKSFPISGAIYFPTEDNRLVFAIPRFNYVYVGTTDTLFKENPDNLVLKKSEINYLLSAINKIFPNSNLTEKNIVSSWVGLRPLVFNEKKLFSSLSRKDELFFSDNGLLTISGGKLTGYRVMAKKTVDLVYKKLDFPFVESKTKTTQLVGGEFKSPSDFSRFWLEKEKEILSLGGSVSLSSFLSTYGSQIDFLLEKINPSKPFFLEIEKAIFDFSKKYEGVVSFEDYKKRRPFSKFSFLNLK